MSFSTFSASSYLELFTVALILINWFPGVANNETLGPVLSKELRGPAMKEFLAVLN